MDRSGQANALRRHGAHVVVADLAEVPLEGPVLAPLPDALEAREELARRIDGKRLAVFLDYDGTLTPIVADPRQAALDEAVRATIHELARSCTVAIVSGRDRADVEALVGIDTLIYAGSHGFDIAGPNGLHKEHERASEFLPAFELA
ncbi:MAG: trehalose-phosphatase, partial [Halofilum sp. (in: g-proteobacteria)]